jgi:tetratricopeptide (TPR) repeat protein
MWRRARIALGRVTVRQGSRALGAALVVCATVRPFPARANAEAYLAVVREYRGGNPNTAIERLMRLPANDVERGLDALAHDSEPTLVQPAAALHTEIAIRRAGLSGPARFEQLSRARALVGRGVVTPAFRRMWSVAVGVYLAAEGFLEELDAHVKRSRASLPDDPEINMLSGIAHEMHTSLRVRPGESPGNRRRLLAAAEQDFRDVLARQADRREAQLRLGRVLQEGGDRREARRLLEPLVAEADPRLSYLAALFLAAGVDGDGDAAGAARWYERATAILPLAQSARVGRSELYARAGRRAEAAQVLRVTITTPSTSDPWWVYPFGEFWRVGTLADGLRVYARR